MKLLHACKGPLLSAPAFALVFLAGRGQRDASRCAADGGWYDYEAVRCLTTGPRDADDFAHRYGAALGGVVIGVTYAASVALSLAARRLQYTTATDPVTGG